MRVILYPLSIRIWHWFNAFVMLVLILTGLQLRFPEHVPLFREFATVVSLHNIAGFALAGGWVAWLVIYLVRRELLRQYLIRPAELGRPAAEQLAYYAYGIFHGWPAPFHPTPEAKFNPLQKLSYAGLMFLLIPLQLITGVLLWDLRGFDGVVSALGGVRFVDVVHVILGYAFLAFLIAHVYLSTLGASFFAHIKAMVLGYEDHAQAEGAPSAPEVSSH